MPGAGHNNIEHDENLKLEYLENLNGFMNSIRNTAWLRVMYLLWSQTLDQ